MMTGLAICFSLVGIIIYLTVAFMTFISIEVITFIAYMIVGKRYEDETFKSLLFSIFWPITIPFAVFMMIVECVWELFKEGCGWISRL